MGPQGIQGIQGVQGVKGATGPQGIQGIAGPTGPAGTNGTNGVTGPTGSTGATGAAAPTRVAAFQYVIDGGGYVPATGKQGQLNVPANCTITGWCLTADQSGSAVVDVLTSTNFAGFPTTASICSGGAGDKPTLSSQQSAENTSVSGSVWTTALTAGQQLQFNVISVSTITRLNICIMVSIP
jgi:hypothetical protein